MLGLPTITIIGLSLDDSPCMGLMFCRFIVKLSRLEELFNLFFELAAAPFFTLEF